MTARRSSPAATLLAAVYPVTAIAFLAVIGGAVWAAAQGDLLWKDVAIFVAISLLLWLHGGVTGVLTVHLMIRKDPAVKQRVEVTP